MGNNHEKNFSKSQRKVLILGVEQSGKTCFVDCINGKVFTATYVPTSDLDIIEVKKDKIKLQLTDFAGCERKRIFWRHHYIGSQGVVFVIDVSQESTEQLQQHALDQLTQLLKERNLATIPICIFLNKVDLPQNEALKASINTLVQQSIAQDAKKKIQIIEGSNKDKKGHEEVQNWLAKEMVSI